MIRMIGTMMSAGTFPGELQIYCHRKLVTKVQMIPLESGDQKLILNCQVTFFDIYSKYSKKNYDD